MDDPGNCRSALHDAFDDPAPAARPSPLFWWSGADVTRERLSGHLDALAAAGIGSTIVGYSHRLDALPDAGLPTPFGRSWWELMRWYVRNSVDRGMTVGFQDYNFVTEALRRVGVRTDDLRGGSLVHRDWVVTGPCTWAGEGAGTLVDLVLLTDSDPAARRPHRFEQASRSADRWTASCKVPAGTWSVCAVSRRSGVLRGRHSTFDPLHPRAGLEHIAEYYDQFAANLGRQLGTGFTTFFQDELDLGVQTPMVNDEVLAALAGLGFGDRLWLHALWHDIGDGTASLRETYYEQVVQRLEQNYFRPIFDWNDQHGTALCMDQLSRGDLRAGRAHYGDYCATMRWYQGPGNDDPDLRAPRSVAAFKVSASIAALNGRSFVMDEAFHSSGWNVTPAALRAGVDQAFAVGASQIALHGLYLSTQGGWWEWAAPDFHQHQPWFDHSNLLWSYITRMSALLRTGRQVCDVAVLDPTEDLDLCGPDTDSPELTLATLDHLARHTIDAHLLDRRHLLEATTTADGLVVGEHTYRVLVVAGMAAVRADTRAALEKYLAASGALVVIAGDSSDRPADANRPPTGTVELQTGRARPAGRGRQVARRDGHVLRRQRRPARDSSQSERRRCLVRHEPARSNRQDGSAPARQRSARAVGCIHRVERAAAEQHRRRAHHRDAAAGRGSVCAAGSRSRFTTDGAPRTHPGTDHPHRGAAVVARAPETNAGQPVSGRRGARRSAR